MQKSAFELMLCVGLTRAGGAGLLQQPSRLCCVQRHGRILRFLPRRVRLRGECGSADTMRLRYGVREHRQHVRGVWVGWRWLLHDRALRPRHCLPRRDSATIHMHMQYRDRIDVARDRELRWQRRVL